ncbi:MAG: HAMP domain-containing histidine kinase [Erysipelotrichaceae bacterium]|nr:HAMP domain-containing histidine kinase [Erysipelotrichaceae bacterium]
MRKFFRSFAGKCTLYITVILSFFITIGSIAGIVICIEENIYSMSREHLVQEVTDHMITRKGYTYLDPLIDDPDGEVAFRQSESSLIVEITDQSGKIIASSDNIPADQKWSFEKKYVVQKDSELHHYLIAVSPDSDETGRYYIMKAAQAYEPALFDDVYIVSKLAEICYSLRFAIYFIALLSAAVCVISFIILMSVAGRRNGDEEVHPGILHSVPYDLLLGAYIIFSIGLCFIADEMRYLEPIAFAIAFVIIFIVGIAMAMSLATHLKDNTLISKSFIVFCFRLLFAVIIWIKDKIAALFHLLVEKIPLLWKYLLLMAAICLASFLITVIYDTSTRMTLWLIETLLLCSFGFYVLLNMQKLKVSGQKLAQGDLSYTTETRKLLPEFRKHAENLNSLAKGMNIAVQQSIKSEKMKTELITNVSHDLKTPLTSLVNYSSLIANEKTDNPKIAEYSEVLLRQSEKLKRLIDDLVEASKATTGNLEVEMSRCDASVFVDQAAGEYQQKLQDAGLTLVTHVPEEEISIMADGRRMWRIFDNLMNNICKYSQPQTRVYLSLEKSGNDAVFTFKNTSSQQLDISEEELMQRFVRGDSSRSSEGNGLGLSIARSLAELQKGSLSLQIDGDLFKAILKFPLAD